eukprot:Plantae.Rhodophyta-Palmaria_palmata.ctg8222.p1 GENE.Plantae.Rhodophyta-Palmaria_palmata.ctg8222~~Plantae.Rhodophyta-Palmaria_palmata.ctg8222.p1  ORF type:complete len:225 (-),score=45.78 Plantae.Rhodophyta-Palmaria_palmata.ctg8222:471-1145(-)
MASDYGVIAFLQPPVLKGFTKPDLFTFENGVYRLQGEDQQCEYEASSKRPDESGDYSRLHGWHALCMMKKIDSATKLEEATEENVQKWFEKRQEAHPFDLSERISSALAMIRYKHSKTDPAGAALTFFIDAVKALDKNNASEIMSEPEKAMYFLDRLQDKVEPPILKERLKMKRATWTKAEKANFSTLQEETARMAVDMQQNEIARTRVRQRQESCWLERSQSL